MGYALIKFTDLILLVQSGRKLNLPLKFYPSPEPVTQPPSIKIYSLFLVERMKKMKN
jgi:hypothetical protein